MFHARSQCRQQHSLICRFDPRAVDEWFDGELRWTDGRLRGGLNIVSRRIRMVLSGIAEELRQPGFASNAIVDLMAAQAALDLGLESCRDSVCQLVKILALVVSRNNYRIRINPITIYQTIIIIT